MIKINVIKHLLQREESFVDGSQNKSKKKNKYKTLIKYFSYLIYFDVVNSSVKTWVLTVCCNLLLVKSGCPLQQNNHNFYNLQPDTKHKSKLKNFTENANLSGYQSIIVTLLP